MEARYWRDYNWPLFVCIAVLLLIGLLALNSATLTAVTALGTPLRPIYPRHIVNMLIGFVGLVAMISFDYRLLSSLARPVYIGVIGLLAAVLVVGRVSEGAQSWIELGTRTFQPSELGKLATILALAAYWYRFEDKRDSWLVQFGGLVIVGVPLLLVLIQPDLGSAIVYATIWLVMAWGSGMRWQQLLLIGVCAIPVSYIGWEYVLDPYQRTRLLTFYFLLVDPSQVDFNDGYNVIQALSAIGAGGWLGAGLTRGLFSQGNYVPVQHTDFIFAVIGEEMGFVGGVVLITFLGLLLWQTLSIAGQARESFGRLIALGIFGMLFCHVVINIGMNMSILPVTGLPLPFISHGGSFLIVVLTAMGLLQSISLRRHRLTF